MIDRGISMGHLIAHGFWRSCSTYFWTKARSSPQCVAYQEPFNAGLSGRPCPIDVHWSTPSRHPEVSGLFNEIVSAYGLLGILDYPQLAGEWDDEEYFFFSDSQQLHVSNLIRAFERLEDRSCFWGFTRGVSKISELHCSISGQSNAQVVSLLINRDPSQHLASFFYQSSMGNFWFESRPYKMWLKGSLISGLSPSCATTLGHLACLNDQELASVLQLLPCRTELSTYLFLCMILKSLLLSLRGWDSGQQLAFAKQDCFLVDDFTLSYKERMRLITRIADAGICIDLDDFFLEHHKPCVSIEQLCVALSCSLKNLSLQLPVDCSVVVVQDLFERLAPLNSCYANFDVKHLFAQPLSVDEVEFMNEVTSQAEDFVLLAENRRLRRDLELSKRSFNEQASRLEQLEAELSAFKLELQNQKDLQIALLGRLAEHVRRIKLS